MKTLFKEKLLNGLFEILTFRLGQSFTAEVTYRSKLKEFKIKVLLILQRDWKTATVVASEYRSFKVVKKI